MTPSAPILVWFRLDLRLTDNPALCAAADRGGPVIPLYIWDPEGEGDWPPGAASRWWLHQSLAALDADLRRAGSRVTVRTGDSLAVLTALVRETGAAGVFWNRRYEPAAIERDSRVKQALSSLGRAAESFNASLLYEPWEVANQARRPFQVFTPFWKACLALPSPAAPLPVPQLKGPKAWPKSASIAELGLEPRVDWAAGFRTVWQPGEAGAVARFEQFVNEDVVEYSLARDRPERDGSSRLSPHLHFGEFGPRQVWHGVRRKLGRYRKPEAVRSAEGFLRQLGWREFAHHLLYHYPHTVDRPLRAQFERFPWTQDSSALRAWRRGRTGYPIVDAGMRALWVTGWMHNRVRMIVASFLVKHLLIPWQEGARWFWETLVDADLANNTLGWQWTAGCGADAAPYFRIFNPVLQGEKLDPSGQYVRRWLPELARLDARWIHKPWQGSPGALSDAGVALGRDYPAPMIDHASARERALAALAALRRLRAR